MAGVGVKTAFVRFWRLNPESHSKEKEYVEIDHHRAANVPGKLEEVDSNIEIETGRKTRVGQWRGSPKEAAKNLKQIMPNSLPSHYVREDVSDPILLFFHRILSIGGIGAMSQILIPGSARHGAAIITVGIATCM